MTESEHSGDEIDVRTARIAELERRLFGRPGTTEGESSDPATPADRAADQQELARLRLAPATHPTAQAADVDAMLSAEPPATERRGAGGSDGAISVEPSSGSRRLALFRLLAAIAIAAVLVGTIVGLLFAPPAPAALDLFGTPATTVEQVRSAVLRDVGLPLLAEGRVVTSTGGATLVAFRAPPGTSERLRDADASLVGNEFSPFGGALYLLPEPAALDRVDLRRSEVCAWVVERSFPTEGRCTPVADFAESGLVFETSRFGVRYAVDWSPAGEA